MTKVQTVLGEIAPSDLGLTLTHEHIAFHAYQRESEKMGGLPAYISESERRDYDWDAVVHAASDELSQAVAEGVRSLVEVTPIGNGRSPSGLAEISRRTGLNIIASTGFWLDPPLEHLVGPDNVDALVELLAKEIQQGMEDTSIRAGIIKVATSERMSANEAKALRAAARASRRTGAAITTHTQRGALALEQIDLLEEEGVDPSRIVIGHLGGTPRLDLHEAVAKRGVYLGYDRTGQGHEQDDEAVLQLFATMVARGYRRQLLISQDTGVFLFGVQRPPLPRHLGGHSLHERPAYTHIWHHFIPEAHKLGVSDEDMRTILVENPARLLPLGE